MLTIVTVPTVAVVDEVGVPDTVNVAVAPAAIEPAGESAVTVKPVEAVMLVIVKAAVPVFLIVNVLGVLAVFTDGSGNTTAVVLLFAITAAPSNTCAIAVGADVPITDTFTLYGVAGSLLGIVITPVVATVEEVGVPETVKVAVAPAAIEPAGETCVTVKPVEAVIVPTVNAAAPVFLTVNVYGVLAVLTTGEGNVTAVVLLFATIVAPSNT